MSHSRDMTLTIFAPVDTSTDFVFICILTFFCKQQ